MSSLVFLLLALTYPLVLVAQAPEAVPAVERPGAVEATATAEPNEMDPSSRTMDPPDKPDPFRLARQGRAWQQEARQRLRELRSRHRTSATPHRAGVAAVRRRARRGLVIPVAQPAPAAVVAAGVASAPAGQPAGN